MRLALSSDHSNLQGSTTPIPKSLLQDTYLPGLFNLWRTWIIYRGTHYAQGNLSLPYIANPVYEVFYATWGLPVPRSVCLYSLCSVPSSQSQWLRVKLYVHHSLLLFNSESCSWGSLHSSGSKDTRCHPSLGCANSACNEFDTSCTCGIKALNMSCLIVTLFENVWVSNSQRASNASHGHASIFKAKVQNYTVHARLTSHLMPQALQRGVPSSASLHKGVFFVPHDAHCLPGHKTHKYIILAGCVPFCLLHEVITRCVN